MARPFFQSNRPLVSVARNNIEILATVAAMAAGAVVPLPDHERMGATAARVTAHLGEGRYRVEGLRLDRPGGTLGSSSPRPR